MTVQLLNTSFRVKSNAKSFQDYTKCKVYDDELIVQELAKKQIEVAEKLDVVVPKKLGI